MGACSSTSKTNEQKQPGNPTVQCTYTLKNGVSLRICTGSLKDVYQETSTLDITPHPCPLFSTHASLHSMFEFHTGGGVPNVGNKGCCSTGVVCRHGNKTYFFSPLQMLKC